MIGLKEVGLDRLICGWQREWVESKIIGEGRKAAKGCKRESGWRMSESAARGAQSGRADLKGAGPVWSVCGWQREWVWDKMIGKNRRGKCKICAEGCERSQGNGWTSCRERTDRLMGCAGE